MKKLVFLFVAFVGLVSHAGVIESLQGRGEQLTKIQVKTRKGFKSIAATNIIEIQKSDDSHARVKISLVGSNAQVCTVDEVFTDVGNMLVMQKENSQGQCEIVVGDFRGQNIFAYENQNKGSCSDFCTGGLKFGTHLFEKK